MIEVHYASPFGPITLVGNGERLCRVILGSERQAEGWRAAVPGLAPYVNMLERYFAGEPIQCESHLFLPEDVGPFRRSVYEALLRVPFGSAITYGELARACGRTGAARAVGCALGANPVPIFIPCHRVVRADGSLGRFSAGIVWKERLLRHEGRPAGGRRAARGTLSFRRLMPA